MRWIVLLLAVVSFNASGFDSQDMSNMTKHPIIASETLSWLTSAFACIPFGSTTENACESLQIKVMKVVRAQPDAAIYLVSNGEIKAAYLEQALVMLRKQYPNASDMELAKAILAY